jgi:alpha-ketoglutarate-dependent taurine dioxygenase
MVIETVPVLPWVGTEVKGLDLRQPLPPDGVKFLKERLHETGFLLFRNQDIDEQQQLRFALSFGRICRTGPFQASLERGFCYVSNTREDGAFGRGELRFHQDQTSFKYMVQAAMLYGVEVPRRGGETLFSNTAHALTRMPEDFRREIMGYQIRHEVDYAGFDFGRPVETTKFNWVHEIVMPHPWSDQLIINSNVNSGKEIIGKSPEASRAILERIESYIADEAVIYRHQWRPGDLVFWDNYLVQHARAPYDEAVERRTLRRCVLAHPLEPVADEPALGAGWAAGRA